MLTEIKTAGNGNPKEGLEKAPWRLGDILTSLRGEADFPSMEWGKSAAGRRREP